jgi:AcrR family transcriptional regulator
MRARAEAVEATRDRIARAAMARFLAQLYDDVTIAAVAADAGVSAQTVQNHFETKEGLFTPAAARFSGDLAGAREQARPRDAAGAVASLMEQYEQTGDGNVRLALLDERIPAVKAALDDARGHHQAFLADVFGERLPRALAERRRALAALHAATDVYTWKLLRRDLGFGRRAAQQVMTETVEAIASAWHTDDGAPS